MSNDYPIAAALVSIGGSDAPVLHVLRRHRPVHVWYFCSTDSRAVADSIQAQLDWRPQARFIEVDKFEELGPCYRQLRGKIPEILAETKVNPSEVLVDYTGGTKTMSAALVLAATELFSQFNYVGGERREKRGLGVTVDGSELMHPQPNPWSDLAIREVERARDLWAGSQFEAAARLLREVAPRVPHRMRFEAIAELADAMAARHRLDFRDAHKRLGQLGKVLPALFDGLDDGGLIAWIPTVRSICEACSKDTASDVFIRELLDNTLRTAAQGRFEDAAARLYRAMEMQGQVWLSAATGGLFLNGRLRTGAELPAPLAMLEFCRPDDSREVKLSLDQLFLALNQLGHLQAAQVAAEISRRDPKGKPTGKWHQATANRNTSILAHGVLPIGADGLVQMKEIASDLLGFKLDAETNPIPPLDVRWLI